MKAIDTEHAVLYNTDALSGATLLKPESVHMIVTSPPYWGLRSYLPEDHPDKGLELGTEPTPQEFVRKLVEVFEALKPALRGDGTLWVNLGDSYAGGRRGGNPGDSPHVMQKSNAGSLRTPFPTPPGLKPKDLCMIPARFAIAMQDAGFYLRSEITWAKPNPMPESVTDRPASATEKIYLFSKKPRYFYDAEAVKESAVKGSAGSMFTMGKTAANGLGRVSEKPGEEDGQRNLRNLWMINPQPFKGSHFATFPVELPSRCIRAGSSERGVCPSCGAPWKRIIEKVDTGKRQKMSDGWDTGAGGHGSFHRNGRERGETGVPIVVNRTIGWEQTCDHAGSPIAATILDPFMGSGTTALAARNLERKSIGFDLDGRCAEMMWGRLGNQEVML